MYLFRVEEGLCGLQCYLCAHMTAASSFLWLAPPYAVSVRSICILRSPVDFLGISVGVSSQGLR